MNSNPLNLKIAQRLLLVSCLLASGINDLSNRKSRSQNTWEFTDSNKPSSSIWDNSSESMKNEESHTVWEVVPDTEKRDQPSTKVLWELLDAGSEGSIPQPQGASSSTRTPPSSFDEAEALLNTIPLQSRDYKELLNLSYAVPTALVLGEEEWRLTSSTLSPFNYASDTGNQNYAIRLDYGLSNTFQISGFYSEADDPLNAAITGLGIRPANLWKVYGAAARWKIKTKQNWSLSLNSSIESWTVGSGGSDSLSQNPGDEASPNIFNDSGKRVETNNWIGSLGIPLTWHANKKWNFTVSPGISLLPSSQGKGQGGSGEFYGTNPYISGGILWHPIPELGLTASISQPFGSGTNSFDRNLVYTECLFCREA